MRNEMPAAAAVSLFHYGSMQVDRQYSRENAVKNCGWSQADNTILLVPTIMWVHKKSKRAAACRKQREESVANIRIKLVHCQHFISCFRCSYMRCSHLRRKKYGWKGFKFYFQNTFPFEKMYRFKVFKKLLAE